MGTNVATKSRRAAPSKTRFLVVWWMSKNPYAAVFENRVAAEAAANVRNAILVAFKGANAEVETVVDWFRRDEEGRPMPAEWRGLMRQVLLPLGTVSPDPGHGIQTHLTKPSDPLTECDPGPRNRMLSLTPDERA